MSNNIVELISVSQEITWNSWAVQYFFFIGLSVGGVLLAAPALLLRKPAWLSIARLGLLVAIATGLVAPVALLSDLHQPARFYQFYLNFTPTSWMSWGAFLLPAYLLSLLALGWQALYRDTDANRDLTRWMLLATTLLALAIALYTGSEMGVLVSRVLWETEWLIPAYLISGLAGAVGLALVIDALQSTGSHRLLLKTLAGSLLLYAGLVAVWAIAGAMNLSDSGVALLRIILEFSPLEGIALWLIAGLLLPLALSLIDHTVLNVITGLLALFGSWMLRWVMFIGGQGIPKSGAGFYDYQLPITVDGLFGILGSFGLLLAILIAVTSLLSHDNHQADA